MKREQKLPFWKQHDEGALCFALPEPSVLILVLFPADGNSRRTAGRLLRGRRPDFAVLPVDRRRSLASAVTEARFTAIDVTLDTVQFTLEDRAGAFRSFAQRDFRSFVEKAISLVMPARAEFNRPTDTDEFLNYWFDLNDEGTI